MTEQNVNRCFLVTRTISLDEITLELAIKIAKHGNVHRTIYASAVGLLKNKTGLLVEKELILFSMFVLHFILALSDLQWSTVLRNSY